MKQTQNIVAAVDQFPQDDPVLLRAAEIAFAQGAKLTIVHVIDDFSKCNSVPSELNLEQLQQQEYHLAKQRIEDAILRHKINLAEIDICIVVGTPSQGLAELSNERKVDLIVMRAHQGDSIIEKVIGSTTDRVIRESRTPVLVIKRPASQAYQQVVVTIDQTESTINHADSSASLVSYVAKLLPSVKLSLLHVVQIPLQFETVMLSAGSGHNIAAYRSGLVRKAKKVLHKLTQNLNQREKSTTIRVIIGDPATKLAQATWNPKVDMIVLGPGSLGKIRRALLGSVTRRLLRNAACDVLVCRTEP
jgi:nucleotide-binding universal stress UspA family protein